MRKAPTKQKSRGLLSNLFSAAVAVLLVAAFVFFLLPVVVQTVLERQLAKATGLPVQIENVQFSLNSPQFTVKEVVFHNPSGFPDAPLAQLRQVRVWYSPSPTFLGWMVLKRVEVDFEDFRLVRNQAGVLNLPQAGSLKKGKSTINEVTLNLKAITYTDLSGTQPAQETFDLDLTNALYRNVKGAAGVVEILSWEVLKRTGVEEKARPVLPEIKPIAESQAVVQNVPAPAASSLPESKTSGSGPSPAPSAQGADSPS